MYVRGYLQGSEKGRVVTIVLPMCEVCTLLYNDFIVNIYIQLDWEQVFTTY